LTSFTGSGEGDKNPSTIIYVDGKQSNFNGIERIKLKQSKRNEYKFNGKV
jgi:hypothetical protein